MKTITTKEFAERLGVSRATIYRMRDAGELPPIIPIRRRVVRWNEEDIELWWELECPKTAQFTALKKTKLRFEAKIRRRRR